MLYYCLLCLIDAIEHDLRLVLAKAGSQEEVSAQQQTSFNNEINYKKTNHVGAKAQMR